MAVSIKLISCVQTLNSSSACYIDIFVICILNIFAAVLKAAEQDVEPIFNYNGGE